VPYLAGQDPPVNWHEHAGRVLIPACFFQPELTLPVVSTCAEQQSAIAEEQNASDEKLDVPDQAAPAEVVVQATKTPIQPSAAVQAADSIVPTPHHFGKVAIPHIFRDVMEQALSTQLTHAAKKLQIPRKTSLAAPAEDQKPAAEATDAEKGMILKLLIHQWHRSSNVM
jgi:hypothetical protein